MEEIIEIIKKRIALIYRVNQKMPDRVHISEEEQKKLENITNIDGVELVVVETPGIKENCVFYNGIDCDAMRELICKKGKCKRFNDKITKKEIEDSIKNYAHQMVYKEREEQDEL